MPITYFVPPHLHEQISVGILVEIPWKTALQRAIVLRVTPDQNTIENIKPITNILTSFPVLHSEELQSVVDVSSYFFLPIHTVLQVFLPKAAINYSEKKHFV